MSVYLDTNATAPLRPEAARAVADALARPAANPSSLHRPGREAAARLDAARRSVAAFLGGRPDEILFTSSGTEAVQTAVSGMLEGGGATTRLVVTAIEHPAVVAAAERAEARGHAVVRVPCDRDGVVSAPALEDALGDGGAVVSVIHAQNETGVVQPVRAIAEACRRRGARLHLDAVQSAGRMPLDVAELGADAVSIASHKVGGPAGAAALWLRAGTPFRALLPGTQEGGRRGGTVNAVAAAGFAAALDAIRGREDAVATALRALRDRLERALAREVPAARVTAAGVERLANTTHLTFDPAVGRDLVMELDLAGYAVSAGSACSSGSTAPSPVLLAMGFPESVARTAVRVSVSTGTTPAELDGFVAALSGIVSRRLAGAGGAR